MIVGGGLAGSTCALRLARQGARVALVEKSAFPRDKPCGEGLLPHGVDRLKALGLGEILEKASAQRFRGILYRAHGLEAPGDFKDGAFGRGVRRSILDAEVQRAALASGDVELIRARVEDVSQTEDRVTARFAPQKGAGPTAISGRVLIGADGPKSRTRHAIGLDQGPPKRARYAIRRHFALKAGTPMPERVEVNVCDGYELYLTPATEGTVGLAALCEHDVMRGGSGDKGERLDTLISNAPAPLRDRLAGATPASAPLACGPLRVRTKGVFAGRAVLVGDAAGYVDALTGEGMSLALATGELASTAVADVLAGESPAIAFKRYARARSSVFRDHAVLTLGLLFLARHPFLVRRAITRLAAEPALFTRLLEVNNGTKSLLSVSPLDFLKLGIGKTPPRRALPAHG